MKEERDTNSLIAEHVMGWKPQYEGGYLFPPADEPDRKKYLKWNGEAYVTEIPSYSADIAAAWTVIHKLRERFKMSIDILDDGWFEFKIQNLDPVTGFEYSARSISAPLAICYGALKAIGYKYETA